MSNSTVMFLLLYLRNRVNAIFMLGVASLTAKSRKSKYAPEGTMVISNEPP